MAIRALFITFLFGSCILPASTVSAPAPPVRKVSVYHVSPYIGMTYPFVSTGIAIRNRNFSFEVDFKASTVLITTMYSATVSKIFRKNKNFSEENTYIGPYFGIGVGGALAEPLNEVIGRRKSYSNYVRPLFPVFLGYQSNLLFIELGADVFVRNTRWQRILPLPTLRLGSRLRF